MCLYILCNKEAAAFLHSDHYTHDVFDRPHYTSIMSTQFRIIQHMHMYIPRIMYAQFRIGMREMHSICLDQRLSHYCIDKQETHIPYQATL